MKVLVFTNMYPYSAKPYYGIFVKEQVESLKKMGVSIDVLFINGEISKWNYVKSIRKFLNIISKRHYDIIHCHHTYCAFIATLQRRTLVILTFHEGEIFSTEPFRERFKNYGFWKTFGLSTYFKRLILKKVDYVISVTKGLDNIVQEKKMSIIPPGVNLDLFRPISKGDARKKLNLPLNKKIVLFPADPNRKSKRFDLAKQALEYLKKDGINILLITLGNVKYEDVPYYMNAADVVLFTSDYEASPMVIKEAMACNIPIVSVDVGDVGEIFRDTNNCYLCQQSSVDIANELITILENREKNRKRTKGREAIQHFNLQKVTHLIMEIYKNTVKAGRLN